jgi:tryptophan 2,3-dioxygenase
VKSKVARVEMDNESLKARLRGLVREQKDAGDVRLLKAEFTELNQQIGKWRHRHEDIIHRFLRLRGNPDDRIQKNQ